MSWVATARLALKSEHKKGVSDEWYCRGSNSLFACVPVLLTQKKKIEILSLSCERFN